MAITETFDITTEEILKPSNIAQKVAGFPEIVIVTFSERVFDVILINNQSKVISRMIAGFEHLIYKTFIEVKKLLFI